MRPTPQRLNSRLAACAWLNLGLGLGLGLVQVASAGDRVSFAGLQAEAVESTPHVAGELLIRFAEGMSEDEKKAMVAAKGAKIVHTFAGGQAALVRFNKVPKSLASASERFADVANKVEAVGLNRVFRIAAQPDDPSYRQQYQHDKLESLKAWDITTGSKDIVVAVIDTGVDYTHPDLVENYWTNPGESGRDSDGNDKRTNGIDDDGNGYVDDFRGWDFVDNDNDPQDGNGHGTHCAGGIGAVGDNGVGVTGINWNVSIVGLKFLDRNGSGSEADAIRAIEYATMMGFDLTSNSWGGDPTPNDGVDFLYNAIKDAGEKGYLFVAAAGNDGRNTDKRETHPASYDLDNIISVAASNSSDRLAGFSNFGEDTVDIAAPGADILSTNKTGGWFNNGYKRLSGTSMAAPLVAGAAALLKSILPDADAKELKDRILRNTDEVSRFRGKLKTAGRLNLYKVLTDGSNE